VRIRRIDRPPKRNGVRYPWREWFRQGKFTLRRGKDYRITEVGIRQLALTWASKLRLSIKTDVDAKRGRVTVEVTGELPGRPRRLIRKPKKRGK
jgi:hypothetical protein